MNAIQKVNGMLLNEKKVFVGRFVPRKEREKELGEKAKKFTNVYIKNFGDDLSDDKLKEMFNKFGKITSYKVVSQTNYFFCLCTSVLQQQTYARNFNTDKRRAHSQFEFNATL